MNRRRASVDSIFIVGTGALAAALPLAGATTKQPRLRSFSFAQRSSLAARLSSSVKMRESHQCSTPLIYLAPSHKLAAQLTELFTGIEDRVRKQPSVRKSTRRRFREPGIRATLPPS